VQDRLSLVYQLVLVPLGYVERLVMARREKWEKHVENIVSFGSKVSYNLGRRYIFSS